MGRKYKILTNESRSYNGKTLYRIQALKDFSNVKQGDIGGWVSDYTNLKQDGNCWIYDNSIVFDGAEISENAIIKGSALIFLNSKISGDVEIVGNVKIGDSKITGKCVVLNEALHGMINIINSDISKGVSVVTYGDDQAQIFINNSKLSNGVNIIADGYVSVDGVKETIIMDGTIHIRKDAAIKTMRDIYFIKMNGENKHVTFYKTNSNSVSVYIGTMGLFDLESLENMYEGLVPDMNSSDNMTLDVLLDTICRHMGIENYKGKDVKNLSFDVVEDQIEKLEPTPVNREDAERFMKEQRNAFYSRTAMK